jgi:hypothetical protein
VTAGSRRTYRFGPLDRGGWILGLAGSQCVAITLGIAVSGLILDRGAPAPLALTPGVVAAGFAFGTVGRAPIYEIAPAAVRFAMSTVLRRRTWLAELPLLTGSPGDGDRDAPLPPFLAGLALIDAGAVPWSPLSSLAGVGVVLDRANRTVSASLRVAGRDFSLLERADQERLIQMWGDALAGFCAERSAVESVRVTEWAAPEGVAPHERYLAAAGSSAIGSEAHRSYEELLAEAGPLATSHVSLVTVTVASRRVRKRMIDGSPGADATVDALLDELRLLSARLEAAGLTVEAPLSAVETAETLRLRCDPLVASTLETRRRSLAALAGAVSCYNAAPLATETRWGLLRADASFHRTYWVAEWPRLEVGPNWLEPLLLHAGAVRCFAIHYEPVAPSRAFRRIDRDATRLGADEEQRARSGFRIGARHRRAEEAVMEREAELVAGYAELEFAGFVTVTAPDEASLWSACSEYEQAAAQSGLEIRPLDGRHDLAFVCTLPLGRGLARRWS